MADRSERWVLNHLIEMCRDEALILQYAADHVTDTSIKALFGEMASRRAQFADELQPHAQRLGGDAAADYTKRGAMHRGWISLKGALLGHSDREMLKEAQRDEAVALKAYEHALGDVIPPLARDVIEQQLAELRSANERLRALSGR